MWILLRLQDDLLHIDDVRDHEETLGLPPASGPGPVLHREEHTRHVLAHVGADYTQDADGREVHQSEGGAETDHELHYVVEMEPHGAQHAYDRIGVVHLPLEYPGEPHQTGQEHGQTEQDPVVEHAAVHHYQARHAEDGEAYDEDENNEDIDIEASPASFQQLPAGYDVKKFDPNYPNGEFDVFNKAILRDIAAGLCTGYAELTGDLTSVNFSSLRHGVIETREVWKGLQEWFKSLVTERVHEEWLKYSLLASKIKCGNGYLKPERIDKYKEVTWTMRRWMWVDPVKDVNSATISVQNGFRSRSDVIREQGRDPDEVWEEIQKENDTLRAKGILVKDEVINDVGNNPEEQTDK